MTTTSTNSTYKSAPLSGTSVYSASQAAHGNWVRQIVEILNNMLKGKLNVTIGITLTPSATTTTISDARIGPSSAILLSPLTANAAAALGTTYLSQVTGNSATITHASNSQVDRTFVAVIIG